jgi:ubiquinone/menaquinone biosynthesis C-methylase UbiE
VDTGHFDYLFLRVSLEDVAEMNRKFKYHITSFTDLLGKLRLYDLLAKWTTCGKGKAFLNRIIRLTELNGNEKILDVGCGTGILACEIAKKFKDVSIFGIDISENLINLANRKINENGYNIDFRVGSVLELPYKQNTFDVVLTSIMFHQLDVGEKRKAVDEIYRVLKPDGRYVAAEFGPEAKTRFQKLMAKGQWTLYPSHLREAGFKIIYEDLVEAMWGKKVFYRVAKNSG